MDYHTAFFKKKEGFMGQQMIVLPPDILKVIVKKTLINNLFLTAIGYYPLAKFHDRKREIGSKEYILFYCTEGEGNVTINNVKQKVEPNQFLIIPPHVPHHYISSTENPWSIYWVHFTGKSASILFDKYSSNEIPPVKPIPYNEERIKNFIDIIQILDHSFDQRSLEIANLKLMYFLSSIIYQTELTPYVQKRNKVTNSIEFMKNNLDQDFKIEDFAENQNLSVSRYSELFKEKTGYPPVYYFNKLRIQKSCQFLYFTNMSIKEICFEVGFSDQYYFSRVFKKIMGVPPSKYKRAYKS